MKTKQLIISAFILGTSLLAAQTADKPATVRMKKTVIVNGVEKTTDTTFTTNDPSSLQIDDRNVNVQEIKDENGKVKKIVTITDNVNETGKDGKFVSKTIEIDATPSKNGEPSVTIINSGEKMTPEEEEKMMRVRDEMSSAFIIHDEPKDGKHQPKEGDQVMIKYVGKCNATKAEIDSVKEYTMIVIQKRIHVVDATDSDLKQLGKVNGIGDNKLTLDKIKFYPNPSNGKFNLAFSLPKKGNTDITILNIEGKSIYNEKLANFSGNYDKEIDISQNPKGAYFIKISQGSNSQIKKILIE